MRVIERKEVSIILPALNEEETVGKVIEEIPRAEMEGRGYRVEVWVVDNGSTDMTRRVAEESGAKIIMEPRRGKGRAVRAALESVNDDFIFILDADYTYPATHIPEMLELLEVGYDVVIGSRLKGHREPGAISRLNFVGNHVLASMANLLYGTSISDLCTGYWGLRREVAKDLNLEAVGFDLEANMFVEIAGKGYRIGEIPIRFRRRMTPSKLGSLKDGLKIGRMLLRKRFRRRQ